MTYTATANNFSISPYSARTYLIQMPSHFTASEASNLQQQFQQICPTSLGLNKIICNFAQTIFMDSSGLVGLCQIVKLAQKKSIELAFASFSPQIQIILSLAGLEEFFPLEKGTEAFSLRNNQAPGRKPLKPLVMHASVCSRTKRFLDICGAFVGLGLTAILLVPIAIALKLDSPGPIFFSQIRCGYRGRKFRIWKFRSMVVNAEQCQHQVDNQVQGPFFKNENDPRITRVGRFLRKTSLDEFPQFWNVLQGEMSLVGTRPPTVKEVENYTGDDSQRLQVKPGLTGEWQVNGRSHIRDFAEVLRLDLQYQNKWTVLYDLKLILQTIQVILSPRSGAC